MRYLLVVSLLLSLFLIPIITVNGQDDDNVPTTALGTSGGVAVGLPDPFDIHAGDFLDQDFSLLEENARNAYRAGDNESAAIYYLEYLKFNAVDGGNIYNLACCYGLLGEADLAALYLERAYNAGFTDVGWMSMDPDFEPVRGADVFDDLINELTLIAEAEMSEAPEVVFNEASSMLPCPIKFPENYDSDQSYPLIIGLHGFGSNPDSFITLFDRFENPDFIYASPRAPYNREGGGQPGFSWFTWAEDPDYNLRVQDMTVEYVANTVNELTAEYNISDVYLLGFSQGCGLAYMAGISKPDLYDGLICFGGWLDIDYLDDEQIEFGKDLRIYISHGTEDTMVEFESGTVARDYLIDFGYDVTFDEWDGPHTVPAESLIRVQSWLSK